MRNSCVAIFSFLSLLFCSVTDGQLYRLGVITDPDGCVGGEACTTQPVIGVYKQDGSIYVGFASGTVSVQLSVSPKSGASLYLGTCDYVSCGTRVTGITSASVPIINGLATFKGLTLKTAGTGYQLVFYGRQSGISFAQTNSGAFSVSVGPAYKLTFAVNIGTAYGGVPFSPNPAVAIADRGGNFVVSVSGPKVTASLKGPTGKEELRPSSSLVTRLYLGVATYEHLYVNEAGSPYYIIFTTTLPGLYIPPLVSPGFTVGVGSPSTLVFMNGSSITAVPVYAGEFFSVAPFLQILDSGGNRVTTDYTSQVTVAIGNNPSGGVLSPSASMMSTASAGMVSFSTLRINRVGQKYTLLFALSTFSQLTQVYSLTSVRLLSPPFDVLPGPPRNLVTLVQANNAWAGGQAFGIQPAMGLTDYGGNLLTTGLAATQVVKCDMIQSLSAGRTIRVDTTVAVINRVARVTVNTTSGIYGVGAAIQFALYFDFEVWVSGQGKPYLRLRGTSSSSSSSTGGNIYAVPAGSLHRAQPLLFRYVVRDGDSSTALDYDGRNALHLNGSIIVDGTGKPVNTSLPLNGLSSGANALTIKVNTAAPRVVSLGTVTTDGEYGVGELIMFHLHFTRPVAVSGSPSLLLNVADVIGARQRITANYSSITNGSLTASFAYSVQQGDGSMHLNVLPIIVYDTKKDWIRLLSAIPTTPANLTDLSALVGQFSYMHNIIIDTTVPELSTSYGIQTNHTAGTLYAGETVYVTLRFTKPVAVSGTTHYLSFQCGWWKKPLPCYASYAGLLNDSMTVVFTLSVPPTANTTTLALIPGGTAFSVAAMPFYIRRNSTIPTADVNTNTSLIVNSLSGLVLYGFIPKVRSVTIVRTIPSNASILYIDDAVILAVKFSLPVVSTCSPVVVMNVGKRRDAVYYSGNGTDVLRFKYTVSPGDVSVAGLYYVYSPVLRLTNALCLRTGCPSATASGCNIYASATNPVTVANSQLPLINASTVFGVPIAGSISVSQLNVRNTTISSIVCLLAPGSYGEGTNLHFQVTFTDVVNYGSQPPRLYMNINKYADYAEGGASKTWTFVYLTTSHDETPDLAPAIVPGTSSALACSATVDHCYLFNENQQSVDITTPLSMLSNTNVVIDPAAPQIVDVWTNKPTSPYDGIYTVGEAIYIFVQFSRKVLVTGLSPTILLNVSAPIGITPLASFKRALSTPTTLCFLYLVGVGEHTPDLTYSGDSLADNGGFIYLQSDVPSTLANYTFPARSTLGRNGSVITIETRLTPYVTSITSLSPAGRYTVGDTIFLKVIFSAYVVSTGYSYIYMNVGDHIAVSHYIGMNVSLLTSHSASPMIPTPPTRVMFFKMVVSPGDYTQKLDYVDDFAFFKGVDKIGVMGSIRAASTSPTVNAMIRLPLPGAPGSLSHSGTIYVDGGVSYQTSLQFISADGSYGISDPILIQMNFSSPVAVIPSSTGDIPAIMMSAGYPRRANYASGNGTTSLIFEYRPQPGDTSSRLDYVSNRAELSSAKSSFKLNGAAILTLSANSSLPAHIYLNPIGGTLEGQKIKSSTNGFFRYLDLSIKNQGPDYQLVFSTALSTNQKLFGIQTVFVSFSNEVDISPKASLPGDMAGWAVSMKGNTSVLGAPRSNVSVTTVQTVTTQAANAKPMTAIQAFATAVIPQVAIQTFYTTAAVGVTIGGYFKLSFGPYGPTRPIAVDVDDLTFKSFLSFDLPEMGNVSISRERYIYCACNNAYRWTLTFNDFTMGDIESIRFDTSLMTGSDVAVAGYARVQEPAALSGGFTLSLFGKQSSLIAFDAGTLEVQSAIATVGVSVTDVVISPADRAGCRTWTVTFGAYDGVYTIPLIQADTSQLSGGATSVWTKEIRVGVHGPEPMSGSFALEWRGNITDLLPWNATAQQVKIALEALPVIKCVNVNRTLPVAISLFTWTIEFVEVLSNSPRGYFTDATSNLEPLIAHNYLIGTNTSIAVAAIWGLGQSIDNLPVGVRAGTFGAGAGAVYVFQKDVDDYVEVAMIHGSDTTEGDGFGSSLDLATEFLIVGAPTADYHGLPEVQAIFCDAAAGTFRLAFRGWRTNDISFNVSRVNLHSSIVGSVNSTANLHSVTNIAISDWGSGGLCENHTAIITFFTPTDTASNVNGSGLGSHLELLTVVDSTLQSSVNASLPGEISVYEVQAGTRNIHGPSADPIQVGAAYIFRSMSNCTYNVTFCPKKEWKQEAQFFSPILGEGSNFGYAVKISVANPGEATALVSEPLYQEGQVHVYTYTVSTTSWSLFQTLKAEGIGLGSEFGHSIGISDDTVVISAPKQDEGRGAIYVFLRTGYTSRFIKFQTLELPAAHAPRLGDLLGWSLSVSGNTVLASAPERDESAIYFGVTPLPAAPDTGAAFVWQRQSSTSDFEFLQKLDPTNTRLLDRFGWSIDLEGDVALVGSMVHYDGHLPANKAIMRIRTRAQYGGVTLGGSFKLQWSCTNQTGQWSNLTTRGIAFDASEAALTYTLEADLGTGQLVISRSNRDVYDGGYTWLVTFVGQTGNVDPLQVYKLDLTGTDASVTIDYVNPSPSLIRSNVHTFLRNSITGLFEEQFFLIPFSFQRADLCGWSVSLSGNYALVGCPNRDTGVAGQNGGAGAIYYLSLLHVVFVDYYSEVLEGNEIDIVIQRADTGALDGVDVLFYLSTMDRNAPYSFQSLLMNLYGISNTSLPFAETAYDYVGYSGKAYGRSQYYGSAHNESIWVDGMYDYRAISDYVPFTVVLAYLVEYANMSATLTTSPDKILESPDEGVSIVMYSPGTWPSLIGRLHTVVTILNNANGVVAADNKTEVTYAKIYEGSPAQNANLGEVVEMNAALGVIAAGFPQRDAPPGLARAGEVILFTMEGTQWNPIRTMHSPQPIEDGSYGDEIKIIRFVRKELAMMAVGEPAVGKVHVYTASSGEAQLGSWLLESSITLPLPHLATPQYGFAGNGRIGLDEQILIVGAPGIEAIFVFFRLFRNSTLSYYWSDGQLLRSSEFHYNLLVNVPFLHRQKFGTSVALSSRTVAVGSPFADYDKLGPPNLVEVDWNTEGTDIFAFGRGKVFVFYSVPAVQVITVSANTQLDQGNFVISYAHAGGNATTAQISYQASAHQMKQALEGLDNIDSVVVKSSQTLSSGTAFYSWTVTFISSWDDPGILVPLWHGFGCTNCTAFSAAFSVPSKQVATTIVSTVGLLTEQQAVEATDKRRGDRFGWSVALDGNQLMVGAQYSSGIVSTSWDFEAGTLTGWWNTGTAFAYQPTFGDNSYLRAVYAGKKNVDLRSHKQTSRMVGRYYIGTYEKRPGNPEDYRVPDPNYPQGSYQGDGPTGTLTSDVFIINGTRISFLLGGGCDYYKIYVELIVEGISVQRLTGKCTERMERVQFDVSVFYQRAAQIRIVDASSSNWGHINVDDFKFDWDVTGARFLETNGKTVSGGLEETPLSGAVYAFVRHASGSKNLCSDHLERCVWSEETKMSASDKRAGFSFGATIAVNDSAGVAVIGAPGATCTGFYKEAQSIFPYVNNSGSSIAAAGGLHFPLNDQAMMPLMESVPLYAPSQLGMYGVAEAQRLYHLAVPDFRAAVDCGAVYVFKRAPPVLDSKGDVVVPQNWQSFETARIQPPDGFAKDFFGTVLSMSDFSIAVGAPGQDGMVPDGGALYTFSLAFASLSFAEAEFIVLEGTDFAAQVVLLRDTSIYYDEIAISYATSDLTALGVDVDRYSLCQTLATADRGSSGCGDYQQTQGILTIPAGAVSGGFSINIMNDLCHERFAKFIQVTLSIPGSAALQGNAMSIKIRIDDDDFTQLKCDWYA